MLQARLLGHFEIRVDRQPISIPSRSTQSLLAFLLLNPNRSHRREKLAGLFWPDAAEANARSNLRHALWRIRKALGHDADTRLICENFGVIYRPQPGDQLDVDRIGSAPKGQASADAFIEAAAAYGGELLPGCYDDWVVLERERIQAAYERVMSSLLDALLAERRWNETLEWGERWIAMGARAEPAYRALMLAQAGLGNLPGAAAQYQRCADALARDLGVEPSEKTRKAFEQIKAQVQEPVPTPLPSLVMPAPLTISVSEKPAPVFVGRKALLTAMDEFLTRALAGQAQVVFICGEAGSGKTSLLQEFVRRSLSTHPLLIIGWGACNAFYGHGAPYLAFRDALDTLVGGFDVLYTAGSISLDQTNRLRKSFPFIIETILEQAPGMIDSFLSASTLSARLDEILPAERTLKARLDRVTQRASASAFEQDQTQLFEQYAMALGEICRRHPLLLVLDDLHWMDQGTGGLFFHLIRRLRNSPILILGAYRPDEVAAGWNSVCHPLEPLLKEYQRTFGNIIIDIDRFRETSERDFTDAYLDTEPNCLDENFRRELHRRTRDHPLFTIELLRNLQDRHEIFPDAQGRWTAAPQINWESCSSAIDGVIGERFARLSRDLQDILLTASVEGEQFTLQILEKILGLPERNLLRCLSRELENRHRMVQELGEFRAGGRRLVRFRFSHSLIQEFLYRQLGSSERIALHRETAEALENIYQDEADLVAAPLARHYLEAGINDKAARYLLLAGDQARNMCAHAEAETHYRQAFTILKAMDAKYQAAQTLMRLYMVYHNAMDFVRAQQTLEECSTLWRQVGRKTETQRTHPAPHPYRLAAMIKPVFDPGRANDVFNSELLGQIYCGLVEASENWTAVPSAATHWEVLNEGRRYIFHLRQDLRWSDGQPVTADDFVHAWRRVLNPECPSEYAWMLDDILGAHDFRLGNTTDPDDVGIKAPDPYTLTVDLEAPCGYFLSLITHNLTYPVPKHVIERVGEAWIEPAHLVTNGPFMLESWDQDWNQPIRFRRNPYYAGISLGNVDQIVASIFPTMDDRFKAFTSGELDQIVFVSKPPYSEEVNRYREARLINFIKVPATSFLMFRTDKPPFDNPLLRRAFAMATDRERYVRDAGSWLPATGGFIPPSLPGHSPNIGIPYDPQEARRLMAAAGYPQGRGLSPDDLLFDVSGFERGSDRNFNSLRDMWEENLGITVQKYWIDLDNLESDESIRCAIKFTGNIAEIPDAISFFHQSFIREFTQWVHSTYNTLVEAARHTLDRDRRINLYKQADKILIEEAVIIPVAYGMGYELRQPWVQKPASTIGYVHNWKDITLVPH